MKPRFTFSPGFPFLIRTALVFASSPLAAVPITWDNSNGTGAWSTPANWDTNTEPTSADDLTFPLSLAGTVTLATTENAKSLQFNGAYTFTGGTLSLATGNSIGVADGVTATINIAMTITGGLSKTGSGTLVLGGSNTNTGGTVISSGRIRVTNTGGLGAAGAVTTVEGGTTLEIGGIALDRAITLKEGSSLLGTGAATSNGVTTIDAAATAVTLGTASLSDVLTLSTAANELTGGTGSTVINIGGPGVVRLNAASNFPGSWNLPGGRLELVANGALGSGATSVTLSGGTLVGRSNTALVVTGPGSNLLLTANSSILSDRTAASAGAGVSHTFGTLSMGTHTLTIAPGVSPTSGTAGITLGNLTLTGNPVLAVNDSGATNGLLTTGSLLGGGTARTITKSGAGDLAVTGGTTDLPAGSIFTSTGGGTIEMLFPDLGAGSPLAVSDAQNPFGTASISVMDGSLRLLANGSGTSAVQTFQLTSAITLGGTVTLDVDERSGANSVKTFELTGLTLTPGTVLSQSGANTYGVRLTGPLVMQGNATLKGSDTASRPGILALDGGISCSAATSVAIAGGNSPLGLTIGGSGIAGGPSTAVTLGGGTSALTLSIDASSSYGGGTTMSSGNVTLGAGSALGSGPLVMTGGSLVVNADNPLGGAISLNGGTLRVNDTNALASTPVTLNGGTLDFRNNTAAVISTGALTFSGTSTLALGNNGAGSSQTFEFPVFSVSGNTALSVTPANSYIPYFNGISLAGNLTLSNTGTLRVKSVTQDALARVLIKAGAGTLELEETSTHSGGTEVIAGILQVEAPGALGGGTLTLGDTSGSTAATANFINGLAVPNNLLVRAGSSGLLTLGSPGGGVTWNGGILLQNALTLANGSTSFPSVLNGVISGSGVITKSNVNSEIEFTNAANSFTGNILVSGGILTVASDGALGNVSNGISLTGATSSLKIKGTFATSRTLTFSNIPVGINVTAGNEFTVNQSLAGTGTFVKTGPGVMTIGPAVDSSLARAGAVTSINGGILRLQGAKNLSDNGNLTLTSGTVEFLRDADTTFPHIVTANDTGTFHVDRAIGGSGTNGRHTLGSISMDTGSLIVTGANGYGLTLGALTTTNTSTVSNNAPGELQIASLGASGGSSSPAMTFGGTGTTRITGAINSGASTIYGITKTGSGTLRFGTSVIGFARAAVVSDGTLDLNGLTYNVNALTLGGAASTLGAQLVTGASGSLALGGTLTFSETNSPPGASITGNLGLGAASRSFVIGNSTNAAVDLTINGPVSGSAGAAINKSGSGTLRFSGAGNTQPGLVTVSGGLLELGKSSGQAIGTGGMSVINSGSIIRLVASEQIDNSAAVAIDNSGLLELADFTETTGPVTFTQTTSTQNNAIRTGPTGTLVLNGNITFNNNTNSAGNTDARNLLITGTGTKSVATTTGTLDLGGATRTILVTSNGPSTNANATIETRVINGGILKTGPRTLFLTNPANSFAGGLQIAQGFVRPGTSTSLGLGPITFSNAPGVAAGIDLNAVTGTLANNFTATSGGESGFTYSALAPNALTLSGNFNLAGEIVFNVVDGTVIKGTSAVLDVTGPVTDGAGTFGLRKLGNGTLKLAPGNTYGGSTIVEKGILAIGANNALGDTTAPLTLDGGCLASTASFVLTRDVTIGANGGNLRADDVSHALELSGALTWSPATTSVDGIGRTVISGTTTSGPLANLVLGSPIAFATGTTTSTTWNTRVCLQGSAALPAGNLSIVNGSVLELGNGDFTRALGTGPGEVQIPSLQGGGWAAVGANRSVNLGGAAATLVWGHGSFLFNPLAGTGPLILGSISATHTVEFQNPVHLTNGGAAVSREIITNDGSATVDARITGQLGEVGSTLLHNIILTTRGTLEITGNIRGNIGITHSAAGRSVLSGTNEITRQMRVNQGTLALANNASLGTPEFIDIQAGATLDATALTVPVTTTNVFATHTVNGLLDGDYLVRGTLVGNGEVTGDLTSTASGTAFVPSLGDSFEIGGNLNFAANTDIIFDLSNTTPETGYSRIAVTGSVTLAGFAGLNTDFSGIPVGFADTLVFILNSGNDPINGTFANIQENDLFSLGDGRFLKFTYLANGDGGPIGNDFGATVVGTATATDLAITATATAAVAPLGNFSISYTVTNLGANPANDPFVRIPRPFNATFAPPYAPNFTFSNVSQDELWVTLPTPLAAGATAPGFTVHFTAPATNGAVYVSSSVESTSLDTDLSNNAYGTVTAVLPGGVPALSTYNVTAGTMQLGIDTIPGIQYIYQRSIDLVDWDDVVFPINGNGFPFIVNENINETKEFFRFGIVPQGQSIGGGGSE